MNGWWNSWKKAENNEIHLVTFLSSRVAKNDEVMGIREQKSNL